VLLQFTGETALIAVLGVKQAITRNGLINFWLV
jgi:hypothetical protein